MTDLKTPLLRHEANRPDRPGVLHISDPKKRALGVRSWIRIDNAGNSHVLEVDKFTIMKRCQLPGRDLRLLDPLFVYPSTILGREKAIVANLEQIRCVITADEVLLLNSLDSYVLQFVTEFRNRVAPNRRGAAAAFEWRSPGSKKIDPGSYDFKESPNSCSSGNHAELLDGLLINSLPFEMKALEVALETTCVYLDTQTTELEDEAYPLLEKLASRINTLNLERVRRLKSRLVGLKRRVERVRDEIEQLMDDDEDMAELYLTKKKENAFMSTTMSVSAPVSPVGSPPQGSRTLEKTLSFGKCRTEKMNTDSNGDRVEEVEMLLEAYFVVVDGILNKLTSLEEYIEDTEDLINIHLDHVRNQLIQFELILTTATFVMAFYGIVAGVFGMNIPLPLTDRPWAFKWILIVSGLVGVLMFFAVILFLRWRKLIPI